MENETILMALQQLVDQVMTVPYQQQRLASVGLIGGQDIRCLDDFSKLPLSSKEDLRMNYPFGLFAVPQEQVLRFHASSGTTGKSTVVGYSKNDILLWGEILAKDMRRLGLNEKDIVQNAMGYGLFTGGLGWQYGVEALGASIIPTSSGNTRRQVDILRDFGTTVLISTPSYALHIAETLEEIAGGLASLRLRVLITGAEPCSDLLREKLEQRLQVNAYDSYGLSEIMGPGVATECPYHNGLHIDAHFYPEVIDTVGNPLPPGEKGELVLSTLSKEALPMLRYRTKDLTRLTYGTCSCGFHGWTMEKVNSRVDDMLIIRGVNVYPSQIEEVLLLYPQISPHYQLLVSQQGALNRLEIRAELLQPCTQEIKQQLGRQVRRRITEVLGVMVTLTLLEPQTLPRTAGKARRIILI